MNYLAHAYLSGSNDALLVGNFIADHLRGNDFSAFPAGVIEGIKLHRQIDTFTDAHPEFKQAKRLFYEGYEKHSGILVDIYFDHLLGKYFDRFSPLGLAAFSQQVYRVYTSHSELLPTGSSRFLDYVIRNNIYHAYSEPEGISTVLFHLSQRIRHNVNLHESMLLFNAHQDTMKLHFERFMNDIVTEFLPGKYSSPIEL